MSIGTYLIHQRLLLLNHSCRYDTKRIELQQFEIIIEVIGECVFVERDTYKNLNLTNVIFFISERNWQCEST